jgi:hypothetical protein
LQHSLFLELSAACSAATLAGCVAAAAATLAGSDLAEPPQHELDMIELLKLKWLRMPII